MIVEWKTWEAASSPVDRIPAREGDKSISGIKKSNCAAGLSEKAKSGLVPFCRAIARKKAPVGSLDLLKFDWEETFGEMMWAAVHARLVWVHTGGRCCRVWNFRETQTTCSKQRPISKNTRWPDKRGISVVWLDGTWIFRGNIGFWIPAYSFLSYNVIGWKS